MIAVLQFDYAGRQVHAALLDNGHWTVTDVKGNIPELEAAFDVLYNPNEKTGPEYGTFGVCEVQKVIHKYKAKVLYARPEEKVERIY
jgi:hypothetical protein